VKLHPENAVFLLDEFEGTEKGISNNLHCKIFLKINFY
jgi:hypothetical protein